jgi:hypothetical protein
MISFQISFWMILGITLASQFEACADPTQIDQVEKSKFYSLNLGIDYLKIGTTKGADIVSMGPSLRVVRALSEKWGAAGTLREGFASSGFTAVYTAWDLDADYAIIGTQTLAHDEVKVGDWRVLDQKAISQSGLGVAAGLSQFLLTGSSSVLVFTGLNGVFHYTYDAGAIRYFIAAEVAQVSSGTVKLSPVGFTLGVALWL